MNDFKILFNFDVTCNDVLTKTMITNEKYKKNIKNIKELAWNFMFHLQKLLQIIKSNILGQNTVRKTILKLEHNILNTNNNDKLTKIK